MALQCKVSSNVYHARELTGSSTTCPKIQNRIQCVRIKQDRVRRLREYKRAYACDSTRVTQQKRVRRTRINRIVYVALEYAVQRARFNRVCASINLQMASDVTITCILPHKSCHITEVAITCSHPKPQQVLSKNET